MTLLIYWFSVCKWHFGWLLCYGLSNAGWWATLRLVIHRYTNCDIGESVWHVWWRVTTTGDYLFHVGSSRCGWHSSSNSCWGALLKIWWFSEFKLVLYMTCGDVFCEMMWWQCSCRSWCECGAIGYCQKLRQGCDVLVPHIWLKKSSSLICDCCWYVFVNWRSSRCG